MMKHKRILAVILAATLAMSGSLAVGATEAEEMASPDDTAETTEEVEIEEYTVPAEESTFVEDVDADSIEEEISVDEENADALPAEEDETAEMEEADIEAAETEDSVVFDTSDMDVGRFTGMKEIAEIDPELLGSDSGIQTFATTYTYSYTYTSLSFSSCDGHSGDAILDLAETLIVGNEGGYNTVVKNDNNSGALSIGKIGFWADSALLVARLIVAEDNDTAKKLLGDSLYNEITSSSTSWTSRTLNDSEAALMKNFLEPDNNPASKTIQDKLARSYIAGYLNNAYGLGIRNAAALVYYADINNQYGNTGGSMGGAKACANYAYEITGEDWSKVTLNELHLAGVANVAHNYAARSNVGSYLERRRYTYGQLVTSGWTYCNSGDYTIPYDSNGYTGAAWLQLALNYHTNAGLTITGDYDDTLKTSVKSYQSSVGLTADGAAGLKTSTKLIHDIYYNAMVSGKSVIIYSGATIENINGVWTYTVYGNPDYTYTGLAKNSNGWYYIKNGVLDRTYTGFATNENGSWYMTEGKLTRKDNTVLEDTKGVLGDVGESYYVIGSKVQFSFTGLADYSNSSGWWYITKGKVDRTVNTVAKNKNGWWYVKNGKVDKSYTGFATNENGSWYMENGKLKRDQNTVIKDTKGALGSTSEWYYVVGSKVQSDFTGLANYKNSSGWWYITKGKVDRSVNTVAKNKNGWWYVKNGKVDKSYTGFATNENGSWYMENGKLKRDQNTVIKDTKGALGSTSEWYYVVDSKVQTSFTGLANYKNSSGWWYITKGKVDRSFNGIATNKNGTYYLKDGKVQQGFTGTVTISGITYSVNHGKVK